MSKPDPTDHSSEDPTSSEDAANVSTEHELLAELADDFARRYRCGEHPSVEQFAQKHPSLANQIRELFPAMMVIERSGLAAMVDKSSALERVGATIGRYKLLERIGEGAFGVVFMAEQQHPVRRKVALKVVKPGVDTGQVIARFEAERQALALMDHENIARVFDAGATESGRPYFVMELVRGIPITDYCDENQLAPRQRLELFVQVCRAVQHAHTKGVIHRDIKPTNVLVTLHDGVAVPKVIDFGVAKATGRQLTERTLFTNFAQMVGTPLYMSPEQAEMSGLDADTRSDIYSLGVLLYELLTGTTPIDRERLKRAAFDEVRRIIRDEEPPPPSTRISTMRNRVHGISAQRQISRKKLGRIVLGELDWIVMKALEKDRNRRYETANDFAADVQRYLKDEAVLACSPSAMYRFRKFAQRNKGAFAIGSAVAVGVLLAVIMLAVSHVWISRETAKKEQALKDKDAALIAAQASEKDAKTAQKEAQENLEDARAAVDRMFTQVADRLVAVPQMEHVRRQLLEDAVKFYQKFLEKDGGDPVIRRETAWAYGRLADIQYRLGANIEAEKSFRRAFAIFEELEAQSPLDASTRDALVSAHLQFAQLLFELGLGTGQEDQKHVRRAAEIAEGLVKEFPNNPRYADLLVTTNTNLITRIRRSADQEEMLRQSLNLTKNPYLVGYIYWQLGDMALLQGRYSAAKKDYLKCLENFEAIASLNPSSNTSAPEPLFGPLNPTASSAQRNLGMVLVQLAEAMTAEGQSKEAHPIYRRATTILDKLANDYPGIHLHRAEQAFGHYSYANFLKKVDRMADAAKAYRHAMELYEKLAADFVTHRWYQQLAFERRLELGRFLMETGQPHDTKQIYDEAVARWEKRMADFPTRLNHCEALIRSHIELGRTLERAGKRPQAQEAFRQVMAISERLETDDGGKPEYRREVARIHLVTAWLLRCESHYMEADKVYRWALELYAKLASEAPQAQQAREDLAFAHFALADHYRWAPGRLKDSEKVFRQALEQYEQLSASFPDLPRYRIAIADGRERLASVLLFQGRLREADPGFQEALGLSQQLEKDYPADPAVRMPLAMGLRHWGETLRDTARPQEAENALRRSEMILSKLAADFPQETWYRLEWGVTCQMLVALLARDLSQLQAAEEFYRRDVDIFQKLAAEFPSDPSYRARLADAHREWAFRLRSIGRTPEAAATFELAITNFSKAIDLGSNDLWGVWYPLALVHLSTGQTAEYRMLCEKLLARFGQSDNPDRLIGMVCRLAPDAVPDLARPVQIAEKTMAGSARDPDHADLVGILGETLYRKGDLNSAVQMLEASARAAPRPGVHWRRVFLAMAYHRLGRTQEAQQVLKETTQWMEKNAQEQLSEGAELRQPLHWSLRLELQLLRNEAEELLGGKN